MTKHPLSDVLSQDIGEGTQIWQYVVILKGAKIGKNCNINCHTFIENDVVIGDNVTVKSGVYLWDGITLEDNVMVAPNVTFTNDKFPRSKNSNFKLSRVTVKKGATIGAAAVILGGVSIGKYALVGAGSVVTKNIPDYAICAGNPARVVGWIDEEGAKMEFKNGVYVDKSGNQWKATEDGLAKI